MYVSKHALDRLRERLDSLLCSGVAEIGLYAACADPVSTTNKKGVVLLECRYWGKKVGYFVIGLDNNMLFVKTFLFITMDGTPEAEKIYQLLSLTRKDKEYLYLDRIESYGLKDFRDMALLRERFGVDLPHQLKPSRSG